LWSDPIFIAMPTAIATADGEISRQSRRGLDWLNFFLADTQTGVGPFLAIYLASTYRWDDQRVGIALSVAAFSGVLAQLPAGALVDGSRSKRAIIAIGVGAVVVSALLFALYPAFGAVLFAQVLLGAFGALFAPALNAITLGLVGPRLLDRRVGRNQAFNSAGNVAAAVLMGAIGYLISNRAIFLAAGLLAIPTLLSLAAIRPNEIDYDRSRAAKPDDTNAAPLISLLRNRSLVVFCCAIFLFHFANAAMLPQLGEMLARGRPRQSSLFMGACIIMTQITISVIAIWVSKRASSSGRKPLLLLGFGVLPVRGVLYTLTAYTPFLVAIQTLDGIANAIYLVVGVLVIADLARGTGRFNLLLGSLGVAQGLGAAASTTFAGTIVHHYGYHAGFLSLAGVAALAWLLIWTALPETRQDEGNTSKQSDPVPAVA
jgi:predicted MFS family arabinose efflux permease